MLRAVDRRRRIRGSLATLLDKAAHELFCVGFEDAIDLVQHAVDVVVERVLACRRLGARFCGRGSLVGGLVATLWSTVFLAWHPSSKGDHRGRQTPDILCHRQPSRMSTTGCGPFLQQG